MHEEQMDHSTAIGHIIESGELEETRSLLGDREKIRYAGIIRAGVKVPKNNCTPQEKTKFKELEAQGLPYDEIDRQLGGEPKTAKSKLFPTNVDYFVIRDCDFRRPGDAAYIREHFKDADGRVRRIPIWLTVGDLELVIPHGFRAFDGSGSLRCVSFYDGDDLQFRYVEKGIKNPKAEDWKVLDSDDEDEATKACGYKVQFGGLYKVNIPGLRGLGEILVPTRSWFGMGDAYAQLRKVRRIMGRFDGLLNGNPFLELCKVQETVKDPDGKKVKQWLITIELAVDPMDLVKHRSNAAERGRSAMGLFNGAAAQPPTTHSTVTYQPATLAAPEQPEEPASDDTAKGRAAIISLGKKAKFSDDEIDTCYIVYGGKKKEETTNPEELRYVYTVLRKALADHGPAAVQESLKKFMGDEGEPVNINPEVEAMIQELERLAEKNGLEPAHIMAHLKAVSGGVDPIEQTLEELQQAHSEISARIKNDKAVFIEEIAQDFQMME